MLRFILVVLANVKRGPYLIPKMRKMFHHPERYSEQVRYAFAQKLINYMKSSGKIKTEVYGTENLPLEGGYVMYPNHQGKYDALGIICSQAALFLCYGQGKVQFLFGQGTGRYVGCQASGTG